GGNYDVQILVTAPGFIGAEATLTVLDDEIPSVPTMPSPRNFSSGQPLELDLRWMIAEGELIQNGDFEKGNLSGWRHQDSDSGTFVINDGTVDPTGPDGALPPFAGRFSALTDQSAPGRNCLFQDVTIPPGAAAVSLRWWDRIRNHGAAFGPNQQFRVEIR